MTQEPPSEEYALEDLSDDVVYWLKMVHSTLESLRNDLKPVVVVAQLTIVLFVLGAVLAVVSVWAVLLTE